MTKYIFIAAFCLLTMAAPAAEAKTVYYEGAFPANYSYNSAYQYYYPNTNNSNVYYNNNNYSNNNSAYNAQRAALIAQINYLLSLIQKSNYYTGGYTYYYPTSNNRNNDDQPDVDTKSVGRVTEYSAELEGKVDMNDFRNGKVFFVYGEDENQVEDISSDYDSYNDVDEDGRDLQKFVVDSSLDGSRSYESRVTGLDDNTDYFYSICVEYEDEDDDEVIRCGGVEDFETDRY